MLTATLHEYEDPPVDMFLERGSLLCAMDQGTGKTVVAIAAAEELLGCADIGLCLVVAPASLKYQWGERIAEHTDIKSRKVKVKKEWLEVPAPPYGVIIDGPPGKRAQQYSQITDDTDYVIMGYDNILDDFKPYVKALLKRKPIMTVLDECSAIKGLTSLRSQRIKRRLGTEYRLGLTATPIENRLEEAFSIMQWVDADVLGRWDFFEGAFIRRDGNGKVIRYKSLPLFHELMSQAMYRKRRSDAEVAPYMPVEHMDEWEVTIDDATREAYNEMGREMLALLQQSRSSGRFSLADYYAGRKGRDESTQTGKIMAIHTAIESLLNHPDLLVISAENYAESVRQRRAGVEKSSWPGSRYAHLKWKAGLVDDLFDSPKLVELYSRLDWVFMNDPDAKVLVYTKRREMLDLLAEGLPWPSVQYHGGLSPAGKAAVVSQFSTDPSIKLFLSSHAGARGCDMWAANHLVNYDVDWSAGTADQINGRHVRASSDFDQVYVHNMVCTGTVEERKLDVLDFKRRIASAGIDNEGADHAGRIDNDLKSLTTWLAETIP